MKRILITQRLIDEPQRRELRDALDARWSPLLDQCGLFAVPYPSAADPDRYLDALPLDGVLFSGGNDLSTLNDSTINRRRDDVEEALLKACLERKLPVLGVCRGAQFLAARYGSIVGETPGHVVPGHPVQSVGDSKLGAAVAGIRSVNSFHRFGINKLGTELMAFAVANDGTVEGFVHRTLPLAGIMWHPERYAELSTGDRALLQTFFGVP